MHRYKITFAYNGSSFNGFQEQPGKPTVQAKFESVLKTLLKTHVRVIPSGRTDTGVHALAQVLHFEAPEDRADLSKDATFLFKLGSMLKPKILIINFTRCKRGFHAQFSVKKKNYCYLIYNAALPQPFLKDYAWHIKKPLDIAAMKNAAKHLVGRHDFSSFCASDSTAKDKVRKIFLVTISTKHPAHFLKTKTDRFITLDFCGSGFLKQMVRILAGTLVAVGLGKITPDEIAQIMRAKDRRKACQTAPAQGLFLKNVQY